MWRIWWSLKKAQTPYAFYYRAIIVWDEKHCLLVTLYLPVWGQLENQMNQNQETLSNQTLGSHSFWLQSSWSNFKTKIKNHFLWPIDFFFFLLSLIENHYERIFLWPSPIYFIFEIEMTLKQRNDLLVTSSLSDPQLQNSLIDCFNNCLCISSAHFS